ncbi:hypothetical protein CSA56_15560 [candidate division KSB3 bacterium]|uniref:Uncharacterized protein n=1 Tax=candidate division KSB3 bacterium TaxID=2044937 RepID=A0A2G6K9T1_9BACT|nr:MAG: hypothetical protein CSA56_15560 [candidate division KSB3 bacterium]
MLTDVTNDDDPRHVEAGKVLSRQLHEAREITGQVECPICCQIFDATHVIKCPGCRTLINRAFKSYYPSLFSEPLCKTTMNGKSPTARPRSQNKSASSRQTARRTPGKARKTSSRKAKKKKELNLDFFAQGYMEYPG